MWFAFTCLVMFCGVVGTVAFLAWRRLADHMRKNPTAAKLVAEYVIAPLLMGRDAAEVEDTPIDTVAQSNAELEKLV